MSDRHTITPYPVRMPEPLREQLEACAREGRRSLHAEIIARLERSIEADQMGLSADTLDTLGLQALLTLTLLHDLDTSKMTEMQLTAIDGLRQVSERVAKRMHINKKKPNTFGVSKEGDEA